MCCKLSKLTFESAVQLTRYKKNKRSTGLNTTKFGILKFHLKLRANLRHFSSFKWSYAVNSGPNFSILWFSSVASSHFLIFCLTFRTISVFPSYSRTIALFSWSHVESVRICYRCQLYRYYSGIIFCFNICLQTLNPFIGKILHGSLTDSCYQHQSHILHWWKRNFWNFLQTSSDTWLVKAKKPIFYRHFPQFFQFFSLNFDFIRRANHYQPKTNPIAYEV